MLEEDKFPPLLSEMAEDLKKEGILLGESDVEVKPSQHFEGKAITATNEALSYAAHLCRLNGNFASDAPYLLKKIKNAAAETEKAASIIRSEKALKCREITQRIADHSREYVHERNLQDIIETLKSEGIFTFATPITGETKIELESPEQFEEKAIASVNEEMRHALALYRCDGNFAGAARILEKIQVAAAETEKAAHNIRSQKALKCRELAQRIAEHSRSFFHELKERNATPKQKVA